MPSGPDSTTSVLEMLRAIDASDAAARLDQLHALTEATLTTSGEHDRLLLRLRERGIFLDPLAKMLLPEDELGLRFDEVGLGHSLGAGNRAELVADEVGERERERARQLGQVDALDAATIGEQWCVAIGKQRSQ